MFASFLSARSHFAAALCSAFFCCLMPSLFAQTASLQTPTFQTKKKEEVLAPRREFRGVWVASVYNIDFPSSPSSDPDYLKSSWLRLLNKYKELNFNAVIVQIRPTGDALYPSSLAPWSKYLTGKQGQAPYNGFDPLAFMISTAHEQGFEFHAWFNPYRGSMDNESPSSMSEQHQLRQHPEWFLKYNKRYLFNPGLPEVREHITNVVNEVVQNYDIDAVHFDDYFYPYRNEKESLQDWQTFQTHQNGFSNIEDWRRNNVDMLIEGISRNIKQIKPNVQFGISPFGVWRNQSRDPRGSDTNGGQQCYDDLYADVPKWLQNGWVDYVVPQIYWTIGFRTAEYRTLVEWWANNSYGKNVYIGLGLYRVGSRSNREPNWGDAYELPRQIDISRSVTGVKGVAYFSSKNMFENRLGVMDILKRDYYPTPALPPVAVADNSYMTCDGQGMKRVEVENSNGVALRWLPSKRAGQQKPYQYLLYRFNGSYIDYDDASNVLTVIPQDKPLEYVDRSAKVGYLYNYAVISVDCEQKTAVEQPPIVATTPNNAPKPNKPNPKTTKKVEPKKPEPKAKKKRNFWQRLGNWLGF